MVIHIFKNLWLMIAFDSDVFNSVRFIEKMIGGAIDSNYFILV